MAFAFVPLRIPEVILITPQVWRDTRGEFAELFKASIFAEHNVPGGFPQINQSVSGQHVLRGLHYQLPPHAQGKLVTLASGRVFDVAVDIRQGSPSYGQWVGAELDASRRTALWVPPGFAHGFCVLSEEAHMIYFCTSEYAPDDERGIAWNDPVLRIDWPVSEPILHPRDAEYPPLAQAENTFTYSA